MKAMLHRLMQKVHHKCDSPNIKCEGLWPTSSSIEGLQVPRSGEKQRSLSNIYYDSRCQFWPLIVEFLGARDGHLHIPHIM